MNQAHRAHSSRGAGRIGVLVPFTNLNLEPDMWLLGSPDVSVHFARMGGYDIDAIPDETQMANLGATPLDEPLRLLAGAHPDVILYGCTSATLTHGPSFDRELAAKIEQKTGAATVTAAGALVHALEHLGAARIGFASPYVSAINEQAIAFLATAGIETVSSAEVDSQLSNYEQGALTPDEVLDLGLRANAGDAEVIVLSCTDMRSVEVIARLEADTGKPVVTSNQAMMFEAACTLGLDMQHLPFGQLFRTFSPSVKRG